MAKLTVNEMNFITNLVNNGTSLEVALSILGIGDTTSTAKAVNTNASTKVEVKPTATKVAKPTTKVVDKSKSAKADKKPTSKASKKLDFGKVKKGDYFKVYNLTDKNNPILVKVGYAKEVSKKDSTITVFTSKDGKDSKKYALENCVAISKKEYHTLSSKLKKAQKADNKVIKPSTAKRLNEHDYTVVMAYLAKKQDNNVDYVELANSCDNKKDLADIRKNIKKELPDFKLTAEEAVKTFASIVKNDSKAEA